MTDDRRTLETTDTSIDVVEKVQEMEGASLSALQEQMDIPKSTLYYHLNTLEERGYLVKDDNEYNIGLKFLVRGQYARTRKKEYEMALKTTSQLAEQINDDVDFSVEEHGQLIVVHHAINEFAKHGFQLGQAINMPSTAAGRAILSEYPRSRVEEIVKSRGYGGGENAQTDVETLFERLDDVRNRGFAINSGEWIEGLCAISSAVKYPDGHVLGALSVIIPSFRFDEENINDRVSSLSTAVSELEEKLEA